MVRKILYLLRIGPGWDVEDVEGIPGKDFGPNWIRGMFFFLYCLLWRRYEYIRVEYFFVGIHYANYDEMDGFFEWIYDETDGIVKLILNKEDK